MSSAGHILDMINRAKANEAMKKYRRSKYKKKQDLFRNILRNKSVYTEINISKEELDEIKRIIRSEAKKENQRIIILWILSFALIATATVLFLMWLL